MAVLICYKKMYNLILLPLICALFVICGNRVYQNIVLRLTINMTYGSDYVTLPIKGADVERYNDAGWGEYTYEEVPFQPDSRVILEYEDCKKLCEKYHGTLGKLSSPINKYAVYFSKVNQYYIKTPKIQITKLKKIDESLEINAYMITDYDNNVAPSTVIGMIIVPIENEDIVFLGEFR